MQRLGEGEPPRQRLVVAARHAEPGERVQHPAGRGSHGNRELAKRHEISIAAILNFVN